MNKEFLLVAVGCGRLPGIFEVADRYGFVVFGAIGGQGLDKLNSCPVYLYETG